jgi:hypothetical protein
MGFFRAFRHPAMTLQVPRSVEEEERRMRRPYRDEHSLTLMQKVLSAFSLLAVCRLPLSLSFR